jgi:formate/nitrite transporter
MFNPQTATPGSRILFEDSCQSWCDVGTRHAASHWSAFIVRSLLTGFYLNLSFTLGVRTKVESNGQDVLFGIFFSFGLIFITLSDSFLFTQDIATVSLSVLLKRTPLIQGLKSLILTFLFNYVGSIIGAFFFGYACQFYEDIHDPTRVEILNLGRQKTSLALVALISRSMFCNWMVCLANFLQAKTDSIPGKVLCVCLPISTFAALGLEHSVVNMTILTLCMFLDGNVFTLGYYFRNIFVAAIGNMMGAILIMTLPVYYTLWLREKRESAATANRAVDAQALVGQTGDEIADPLTGNPHF